ncbi:unnamed protein product [Closterium sp. Naga37s-1]|nr:unnamed protein product [Closterium sp. Naga37s-1]
MPPHAGPVDATPFRRFPTSAIFPLSDISPLSAISPPSAISPLSAISPPSTISPSSPFPPLPLFFPPPLFPRISPPPPAFRLELPTFRLGLPSLFAYHRKPLVSKQGTSFATAAAGARNWVYAGKTRSLQTQIAYMQEYKDKRQNNPQVMLDQSLIMISAGTNDYVLALLGQSGGQSVEQVLSATTGAIVKAVQDLNAMTKTTKIVVFDVPPLGCIPAVRYFEKTPAGQCDAAANKLADQHNTGVRVKLEKLRQQGVTNLILFKQSTVYRVKGTAAGGFIDQTSVCCEGKTPSGKLIACGQTVKEGGKSYSATACKDPTKYVWWDWYNPTEAFNEVLSGILWHSNSVSYVSPFGLKAIVDK